MSFLANVLTFIETMSTVKYRGTSHFFVIISTPAQEACEGESHQQVLLWTLEVWTSSVLSCPDPTAQNLLEGCVL